MGRLLHFLSYGAPLVSVVAVVVVVSVASVVSVVSVVSAVSVVSVVSVVTVVSVVSVIAVVTGSSTTLFTKALCTLSKNFHQSREVSPAKLLKCSRFFFVGGT